MTLSDDDFKQIVDYAQERSFDPGFQQEPAGDNEVKSMCNQIAPLNTTHSIMGFSTPFR
jgi:hypothetical protein